MKQGTRYKRTRANDPNLLLMIGTGRSGTTLAKRYLAEHPTLRMVDHAAARVGKGCHFALMRYEDLVADPIGIKMDFCSWLGIESGELTTRYSTDTRFARREVRGEDPKAHESGRVHGQSSGRWRHVQDAEQARLTRSYGQYATAQRLMQNLGYGDERLEPPSTTLAGIRIFASAVSRWESPLAYSDRPGVVGGQA